MTVSRNNARESFYIAVQNTVTGFITRVAFPEHVQIGLDDEPGDLTLTGRLNLTTKTIATVTADFPGRTISCTNDDLVVAVSTPGDGIPTSVILPSTPQDGQLLFIKDTGGSAAVDSIIITPGDSTQLIDTASSLTINTNHGATGLCWVDEQWRVLTTTASSSGGGAPVDAKYIVIDYDGTLTDERKLAAAAALTISDAGANSTVTIDLATQAGVVAGAYTNSNVTVNSKGIVTAISNGSGGSGADPEAQYIVMAVTASLPNERALAAGTGITKTDGGAGSTVTLAIDNNVVATVSGTTFTGVSNFSAGLSGSLTRLIDGSSYIEAGANITVTSQSNGSIIIASTGGSSGPAGEVSASYIVLSATSSLANERVLTGGSGIILTDGGAGSTATLDIDDNIVATVSGTTFTGASIFSAGLSGSLTKLEDNSSYLVAGANVTITSQSNGQVVISSTGGSPIASGTLASYSGYSTSSVLLSSPTWDYLSLSNWIEVRQDNITLSGSTFIFEKASDYVCLMQVNGYGGLEYASLRLSGSNGPVLQHTAFRNLDDSINLVLMGIFTATANSIFDIEYAVQVASSGSSGSWDPNGQIDGMDMRSVNLSFFSLSNVSDLPVINMSLFAGSTSTMFGSSSKKSIGMTFFDPALIAYSSQRTYTFESILAVTGTIGYSELYDYNGIVTGIPGPIVGSTLTASAETYTKLTASLSALLQTVTGSGIIDTLIWCTPTGSSETVYCRGSRLAIT